MTILSDFCVEFFESIASRIHDSIFPFSFVPHGILNSSIVT